MVETPARISRLLATSAHAFAGGVILHTGPRSAIGLIASAAAVPIDILVAVGVAWDRKH